MRDPRSAITRRIRSVGRALDLLDIMQRAAPAGIRVSDAAAHLGVDPATASRLLATLITRGYASRMQNRRYTLGARSLRLASAWIDRLLQVAAAPMTRIANGCGETVYLLQLVGTEAVTLARLAGSRRAMVEGEIGPSYPLWATAAGRALLGTLPRTQGLALLPPEPFPAFTSRTKTTWAEVIRGDAGWPAQRHSHRGRRDRPISQLLRHAASARRHETRSWRWRSASSRGVRRATAASSGKRCDGNGGNSPGRSENVAHAAAGKLQIRAADRPVPF